MNLDFILELAKNPFIVVGLSIIVTAVLLALIITQPNLVGMYLRKILKLSTDNETVEFVKKITNTSKSKKEISCLLRK